MTPMADALVIGGGPAGASAAIRLAQAGWRVSLVEQHAFPRQKVCGECIAASSFQILDELGVGDDVRRLAGPEHNRVGWMGPAEIITADMPRSALGADGFGRALGRDVLDALLLQRVRDVGVSVFQPARVRAVRGSPGAFLCDIVATPDRREYSVPNKSSATLSASVLIDACGSWDAGPRFQTSHGRADPALIPKKPGDLFAFKATFAASRLLEGFLPVIAMGGGYGGMVVADGGRTTVAICLRRDTLRSIRARYRGRSAGSAVERHLRESCHGVSIALRDSVRQGAWLTVGPLRPGVRLQATPGIYRVGNSCAETHPLVGEGMSMAFQSARMLVDSLLANADRTSNLQCLSLAHQEYARTWRAAFGMRLRVATAYAHIAMNPALSGLVGVALRRWPALLTTAARLAGKAHPAVHVSALKRSRYEHATDLARHSGQRL